MSKSRKVRGWTALVVGLAVLLAGLAVAQAAVEDKLPLHLTALAVNLGGTRVASGGSGTVQITIERWSTPEERAKLIDALQTGGPDALLEALQKTPRVGFIRTPDTIAWDLHYASERAEDGGRRIFLATDRRMGFWEVANNARSVDYPFTLIEIHMDKSGKGEGRLSLLTKVTATPDKSLIVLENYNSEPVRLQAVRASR